MSGSSSPRSPLASLVLFILALAFAATLCATVHYILIDLPQHQNDLAPPANSECGRQACWLDCSTEHGIRLRPCTDECIAKYPNANWWLADAVALEICMDWCWDNTVGSTACKEECERVFNC